MAQYALLDGEPKPVTHLGQRATCVDHRCRWEMVAVPGNGQIVPHWRHQPGSKHVFELDTEKGEWHQEVQSLFEFRGAHKEVWMPSADGTRKHAADVVCPDGRIIEAQTKFLSPDDTESREATYGDMAWLYDARDFATWFVVDNNNNDSARFIWGCANRKFFAHTKPVFFDAGEQGIWKLEWMQYKNKKGNRGRAVYEGRRAKVADTLIEFVDKVMASKPFGAPPRLAGINPRKDIRGTRLGTLQDVDEWMRENAECNYIPSNPQSDEWPPCPECGGQCPPGRSHSVAPDPEPFELTWPMFGAKKPLPTPVPPPVREPTVKAVIPEHKRWIRHYEMTPQDIERMWEINAIFYPDVS